MKAFNILWQVILMPVVVDDGCCFGCLIHVASFSSKYVYTIRYVLLWAKEHTMRYDY